MGLVRSGKPESLLFHHTNRLSTTGAVTGTSYLSLLIVSSVVVAPSRALTLLEGWLVEELRPYTLDGRDPSHHTTDTNLSWMTVALMTLSAQFRKKEGTKEEKKS